MDVFKSPLAKPRARRRLYNDEAEAWVWATFQQVRKNQSQIKHGFIDYPKVRVQVSGPTGRGLFATQPIEVGEPICTYGGTFMRETEADNTVDGSYDVEITPGWVMRVNPADVGVDKSLGLGPFCNDVEAPDGFWHPVKGDEYYQRDNTRTNARLKRVKINVPPQSLNVLIVSAIWPIKVGDEIFVSYGDRYWEDRTREMLLLEEMTKTDG